MAAVKTRWNVNCSRQAAPALTSRRSRSTNVRLPRLGNNLDADEFLGMRLPQPGDAPPRTLMAVINGSFLTVSQERDGFLTKPNGKQASDRTKAPPTRGNLRAGWCVCSYELHDCRASGALLRARCAEPPMLHGDSGQYAGLWPIRIFNLPRPEDQLLATLMPGASRCHMKQILRLSFLARIMPSKSGSW